jgi:UDP-perosamine 4-acetyltransferase
MVQTGVEAPDELIEYISPAARTVQFAGPLGWAGCVSRMRKIHREGVDIDVAFDSQMRRAAGAFGPPGPLELTQSVSAPQPPAMTPAGARTVRTVLRSMARLPARVWRRLRGFRTGRSLTSRIVVIGASGHAKVVIDILRDAGEQVECCVGTADSADTCVGAPVLRGDEHLPALRAAGLSRAIVAIGSNEVRERLARAVESAGFELASAVSPRAVISPSAKLGRGVAVMPGVIVGAETIVEDLAILNTGATIDHDCRVGRAAHVAPRCALAGRVEVGAGSLLGVGCSVVPGVRIGRGATVGAGGVVTSDVPDGVTVVGVPARPTTHGRPEHAASEV